MHTTALADGTPEVGREIIPKIRAALNQAQALNAVQKHNPNPTPRRWILDRWLPAGRTVLFAGPGGKGKSRLALQLAVNIVTNGHRQWVASDTLVQGAPERMATPHFGAEAAHTSPPVAVYASWEDEASEIDRRLACLGASEAVEDRLHFVDLAGRGALWELMQTGSRHTSTLGALAHVGVLLRAYCEQVKARLLVVDPLAAAYACNENDRGLVCSFMRPGTAGRVITSAPSSLSHIRPSLNPCTAGAPTGSAPRVPSVEELAAFVRDHATPTHHAACVERLLELLTSELYVNTGKETLYKYMAEEFQTLPVESDCPSIISLPVDHLKHQDDVGAIRDFCLLATKQPPELCKEAAPLVSMNIIHAAWERWGRPFGIKHTLAPFVRAWHDFPNPIKPNTRDDRILSSRIAHVAVSDRRTDTLFTPATHLIVSNEGKQGVLPGCPNARGVTRPYPSRFTI
ncbi:MAG: AAA family ATPase [Chloroflexi bacterium]|nr:AAA family ATPase [Chloroflexota bacterium]